MPVASARDCPYAVSRSSSVRVRRVDRVALREARVRARSVRESAVRCIRRATCLRREDVQWAVARWVDVRWALDRVWLRRMRRVVVREHAQERLHGVRDSVTRLRAVSKKDR